MTEDVLSYALLYHEKGLAVFPLRPRSKEPYAKLLKKRGYVREDGVGSQKPIYDGKFPTREDVEEWFKDGKANIAIACGKVSGNLIVIDFDSKELFEAWYRNIDIDYPELRDLVTSTWIVETGKGIHVYFRLKDPSLVPSTKVKVKGRDVDIKGNGGYVVAPPSIHPSGKQYQFRLGPNSDIAVIEDVKLWKDLLRSLGLEEEKKETKAAPTPRQGKEFRVLDDNTLMKLKELLKPAWVRGQRQELSLFLSGWLAKARVHPVSAAKLYELLAVDPGDEELKDRLSTIYYSYRKLYGGIQELKELDELIEKRKAEGIIRGNVSKAVSKELEERIKGKSGVQEILENTLGEEKALDVIREIEEILGVSSPFRDSIIEILDYEKEKQLYAVANLRKLVVVRARRKDGMLMYKERITVGAPTKVTLYINPFGGITKYEVVWETRTRPRPLKIGPAYIEDIVDRLKAEGLVLNRRLAHDVINAIIEGYVRKGKAEIKEEIEAPGFYLVDGKILAVRWEPREVTREELREALELLNDLATNWFRHVQERFATVIKWYVIAPFIYIYKQKKKWVVWLYLYGPPDTGKSTQSKIGASIWGLTLIEKPGSAASTPARLEKILSETTFPVMIKEPGEMFGREDVTEMIKSAIEDVLARAKVVRGTYVETPALAPIAFTSNRYLPREPGLVKRFLILIYTYGEKVPEEKQKLFKEEVEPKYSKLAALGYWIANKIINNPELLEIDWKQLSTKLLKEAYEEAELEAPEWINLWYEVEENVYEDIKEGIRNYLIKRINEEFTRFVGRVVVENGSGIDYLNRSDVDFEERVRIVLKKKLLPWAVLKEDDVIFTTGLTKELQAVIGDIGGLKSIAELLGWEYGVFKVGKKSIRGAKVKLSELIDFLS